MRMLPQNDITVRDYFQAFKKLRHIDGLIVDVGISQPNEEILFSAADKTYEALKKIPELTDINYRFELGNYPASLRLLQASLPNLLETPEEYKSLEKSIQPESIRKRLNWLLRSLSKPEGFMLKDIARIDPIGLSSIVLQRLKSVQTGFGSTTITDGRIVSGNRCHVLITAMPCFPSSDVKRSVSFVESLLAKATAIDEEFSEYGVHVAIGGGHRIGLDNSRLIRRDAGRALSIAAIAMLLLSFISYRRKWLALITLIPTVAGAAVAGAVLYFAGKGISGIAVGCGAILLGITVDYAIHILYHIDNSSHADRRSIAKTVSHIIAPIGFGALTTLSAFLVMILSPVESHRQVGIFAAIGVTTAALISIFLLPVFVPTNKRTEENPLLMTRLFERFFIWRSHHISLLIILITGFSLFCMFGISNIEFEGDIAKLNGVTAEMAADEQTLWDAWGDAASMTTIMVSSPDMESALQKNSLVAKTLNNLKEKGIIESYSSVSPICPSAMNQKENIKRWQEFWTRERINTLKNNIKITAPEVGFRTETILKTLTVIENNPDILLPKDLQGAILEQLVKQHVHYSDEDISISTVVTLPTPEQYDEVAKAINVVLPETVLLNRVAFSEHIAGIAKHGLGIFAILVTIIVTIVLFFLLGSIEMVLITLLPIAVGLLWTFGLMGLLGVSVNVINFIFVIFVIGIGIDYSLFLVTGELSVFRGKEERQSVTSGSIVICSLTTMCGFGVLAVAQHPALYSIGITAFLGMLFSLIATLLIVPFGTRLFLHRSSCGATPRLRHIAGGIWCLVYLLTIHIVLLAIALPVSFIIHPRNRARRTKLLRRAAQNVLSWLAYTFPYGKIICTDITRKAFEKPSIIVSNHHSIVDIPFLARLPCDLRLTIKDRWWNHPLIGAGVKVLDYIHLERGNPEATINKAALAFKEASSILFFPQGTRSPYNAPKRFHKGAFELAIKLNADIQPIVLCDTWTCLPVGGMWVDDFRMRMKALPKITPSSFDYNLGSKALSKHVAGVISSALQEETDLNNTPNILRRKVGRLYRYQGVTVAIKAQLSMRNRTLIKLHNLVPKSGLILDLGCGYGIVSQWLALASPKRTLLGIDNNPHKTHVAQHCASHNSSVDFKCCDYESDDLPSGCNAVLLLDNNSLTNEIADIKLLKKIFNALKPEGCLIIQEHVPQTELLQDIGFSYVEVIEDKQTDKSLIVARRSSVRVQTVPIP